MMVKAERVGEKMLLISTSLHVLISIDYNLNAESVRKPGFDLTFPLHCLEK